MTIVTAASSNHFRCLENLLYTISLFEPDTRTLVYDLGLTRRERGAVRVRAAVSVRRFQFDGYPDWLRLSPHGGKGRRSGAYAWKAPIVHEGLADFPGPV